MRIYTRGGDKGTTSLIYGRRIRKDSARVAAYGNVDEVNSVIGFALGLLPGEPQFEDIRLMCTRIQRDLFDVGRDLATPAEKQGEQNITEADVRLVEQMIDRLDAQNPTLKRFVLPGGHPAAAALHMARTVTRRCERSIVAIDVDGVIPAAVPKYINRLSDFLFVAARCVNTRTQTVEPGVDFNAQKPNFFLEMTSSSQVIDEKRASLKEDPPEDSP